MVTSITVDGVVVDLYSNFSSGFYHGPNDVIALTKSPDGSLTFTKSNNSSVSYYVVSVGVYTKWIQDDGREGTDRFYATEKISATDAESYNTTLKVLPFVDSAWVSKNATAIKSEIAGNAIYTLNGNSYYLISGEGRTLDGDVKACGMISVSAYDTNGNLISSATLVP